MCFLLERYISSNKNDLILEKILEKNITLFGLKYQPNRVAFMSEKMSLLKVGSCHLAVKT